MHLALALAVGVVIALVASIGPDDTAPSERVVHLGNVCGNGEPDEVVTLAPGEQYADVLCGGQPPSEP